MGHQIPGATILKPCFEFLDNPMKNELDAEMNAIIYPNEYSRIYSQSITPIIRVRNTGATPITSIHFTYIINDVSKSSGKP